MFTRTFARQLLLLALLLGAFAVVYIADRRDQITGAYPEAKTIAADTPPFSELEDRFTALAKKKGAAYAYEVLKRAIVPPGANMHLLGHDVGNVLYEEKGPDAIADCTLDWRNACSHAVVIGAMQQYGEKAFPLIQAACAKAPGGLTGYNMCYHGSGHGIVAFYGYSLEKIIPICKTFGTKADGYGESRECFGGAVMEIVDGGGHDHDRWVVAHERYLDPKHPLAPCMSDFVPTEFKTICLIYLTPQLFQFGWGKPGFPPNSPEVFQKAFTYCDLLPKDAHDLRDACYGGFGKEFVSFPGGNDSRLLVEGKYTDAMLAQIDSWCSLAGNDEGYTACTKTGVGGLFWGGAQDPSMSFRYCGLIGRSDIKSVCFDELSREIQTYIKPGITRNALCIRLPDSLQNTCEGNPQKSVDYTFVHAK